MLLYFVIFIGAVSYIGAAPSTNAAFESGIATITLPSPRRISIEKHVDEILSFWNDAKLQAAKPILPRLNIGHQSMKNLITTPDGPPVFTAGTNGSLQNATEVVGPKSLTGKQIFASTGRQTYTTGKIFWTISPNSYGICSGVVVTAGNKDTILTAGHCCFDNAANKWNINQNFIFIPNYKNGARPYGTWAARTMTILNAWVLNKNYNYDVCFVNLYTNSKNQHIQDVVGSEGIGANYPRNALMYSFGYPYNLDKGEVMQYCSGTAQESKFGNGYNGQTIPCDMAGGCSGGPWLQSFDSATGVGYVTSLNSFTINNIANYINGPYFDSSIWSLYQQSAV